MAPYKVSSMFPEDMRPRLPKHGPPIRPMRSRATTPSSRRLEDSLRVSPDHASYIELMIVLGLTDSIHWGDLPPSPDLDRLAEARAEAHSTYERLTQIFGEAEVRSVATKVIRRKLTDTAVSKIPLRWESLVVTSNSSPMYPPLLDSFPISGRIPWRLFRAPHELGATRVFVGYSCAAR